MLFIFKQENASEMSTEGEEIVSLAACNIEIVSNVTKTFVQIPDFSEMNRFSLTTQKFRGSAENIKIYKVDERRDDIEMRLRG